MAAIDGRTPFKYQNEVSSDCAIYRRTGYVKCALLSSSRGLAIEMFGCQVSRVIVFIVFPTSGISRARLFHEYDIIRSPLIKYTFFGFIPKNLRLSKGIFSLNNAATEWQENDSKMPKLEHFFMIILMRIFHEKFICVHAKMLLCKISIYIFFFIFWNNDLNI